MLEIESLLDMISKTKKQILSNVPILKNKKLKSEDEIVVVRSKVIELSTLHEKIDSFNLENTEQTKEAHEFANDYLGHIVKCVRPVDTYNLNENDVICVTSIEYTDSTFLPFLAKASVNRDKEVALPFSVIRENFIFIYEKELKKAKKLFVDVL